MYLYGSRIVFVYNKNRDLIQWKLSWLYIRVYLIIWGLKIYLFHIVVCFLVVQYAFKQEKKKHWDIFKNGITVTTVDAESVSSSDDLEYFEVLLSNAHPFLLSLIILTLHSNHCIRELTTILFANLLINETENRK